MTAHLRRRDYPQSPVPAPDPTLLIDTWEQRRGGGVCFDIAAMAEPLLVSLGYDAHLILAHISGPFGHQAIVVNLDGRRYLLDLGIAVFAPIPLDEVVEVHHVGVGFRFRPSDMATRVPGGEEWIRDRWSEDGWIRAAATSSSRCCRRRPRCRLPDHHMTLGHDLGARLADHEPSYRGRSVRSQGRQLATYTERRQGDDYHRRPGRVPPHRNGVVRPAEPADGGGAGGAGYPPGADAQSVSFEGPRSALLDCIQEWLRRRFEVLERGCRSCHGSRHGKPSVHFRRTAGTCLAAMAATANIATRQSRVA